MPAYNEQGRIAAYLLALSETLAHVSPNFVVIDDCSTDATQTELAQISTKVRLCVERNSTNSGHGPSTLRALGLGIRSGSDVVMAIDGDGQADPVSLMQLVEEFISRQPDVAEGIRIHESAPWFRRTVSMATCALVWSRSHEWPRDANTPVRIYQKQVLNDILTHVPSDSMVPNLHISALTRSRRLNRIEHPVLWRPPVPVGNGNTHWGKTNSLLPTRRFVNFCAGAVREWLRQ